MILGLNCYTHDSSITVISGESVFSIEEERLSREKHTSVFPHESLELIGNKYDTSPELIVFPWLNTPMLFQRAGFLLLRFPSSLKYLHSRSSYVSSLLGIRKKVRAIDILRDARFVKISHHMAHMASAFYPSGFDESLILSIDHSGEFETMTVGIGRGNLIEQVAHVNYPHSLGMLYSDITQYLGFKAHNGEGKLMGLAPYGTPKYFSEIMSLVRVGKGRFSFDLSKFNLSHGWESYITEKFERKHNFYPHDNATEFTDLEMDMAASLQKVTEEVLLEVVRYYLNKYSLKYLCMAGGVALNSVANGRLLRETDIEDMYVQPASNDAGTSLGAALYGYYNILGNESKLPLNNAYLGPAFDNEEILNVLKKNKLHFTRSSEIEKDTALEISRGKIVGWYQGKMEFGPRALGNRSILADPRKKDMKDLINEKVKHREGFRPFAPSVLEEKAGDYFIGCGKSPYMTIVFDTVQQKRKEIPAVVHVDGTARVQTVSKEQNGRYYSLIREFEKLTGIPLVLNTSFNIRGEPIVCTPQDAINTFSGTGIDILVMGDYKIEK
ncbi:carbamoyl transferase [bacterium]|nr:carbamoyl transferase [bacterium]